MREHMGIFRGKRIDNGEWVEGYYIAHLHAAHYIIPFRTGGYAAMDNSFYVHKWFEVDPDTVGECAGGLTDKNGELIFEGDILRPYEEETEREADGYCVIHFGRFKDTDALSDFDHLGWHITVTTIPNEATTVFALEEQGLAFEIIGNIHDNPELLKGGEADE